MVAITPPRRQHAARWLLGHRVGSFTVRKALLDLGYWPMTPILALVAAVAIMARAEHMHRTIPAVEAPARTVGVLSIVVVVLSLAAICG